VAALRIALFRHEGPFIACLSRYEGRKIGEDGKRPVEDHPSLPFYPFWFAHGVPHQRRGGVCRIGEATKLREERRKLTRANLEGSLGERVLVL